MRGPSALLVMACALLAPAAARAQFNVGNLLGNAQDTVSNLGRVAKGVNGIGPEEESVIGGSVALEIVGAYGGLVRDAAVVSRVNLVGKALARYSDRPELTWRFGVLNSATVNAFSAPSGYVFITRGLYDRLGSDDALAGVLAHEVTHITRKHALKIVARGEFLAGASGIASQQSANFAKFDAGIGDITKTLLEKGFDPKTEFEADRGGRDLAALAGYAPGGLRGVLIQLQSTPAGDQAVFSTHPPLAERIQRLPADPAG